MEPIIANSLNDIFHFKTFVFAMRIDNLSYKPVYLSGVDDYPTEKEFEITIEIDKLLRKTNIFAIEALNKEPEFFRISQGEMIVSLMMGNDPYGFFIVGPKMSEKSYSMQDIRVLSLLANRVVSLYHTASLYKKDLDRQVMLEKERERIAKDLHDYVGASLTRISILYELAKNNVSDTDKIQQWLKQIGETSRDVIHEMSQIIWTLDPKSSTFEGLIAYIRRYSSEYLELDQVKCIFDLPEEIPGLALSMERRRNIYLIIRETLHNVLKHAAATKVFISLKMIEPGFMITIKDNGVGFDPGKLEFTGNGLINMKKRTSSLGGQIHIQSNEGKGTEISIVVPVD